MAIDNLYFVLLFIVFLLEPMFRYLINLQRPQPLRSQLNGCCNSDPAYPRQPPVESRVPATGRFW